MSYWLIEHCSCWMKLYSVHCLTLCSVFVLSNKPVMPMPAINCWRHIVFGLSMTNCVHVSMIINEQFVSAISYKHSWELQQIYNFSEVVNKSWTYNYILRSAGQGHSKTNVHFSAKAWWLTVCWAVLTVLWIGFCLTGPISLCVDCFMFTFVFFCVFILSYCIGVVLLL